MSDEDSVRIPKLSKNDSPGTVLKISLRNNHQSVLHSPPLMMNGNVVKESDVLKSRGVSNNRYQSLEIKGVNSPPYEDIKINSKQKIRIVDDETPRSLHRTPPKKLSVREIPKTPPKKIPIKENSSKKSRFEEPTSPLYVLPKKKNYENYEKKNYENYEKKNYENYEKKNYEMEEEDYFESSPIKNLNYKKTPEIKKNKYLEVPISPLITPKISNKTHVYASPASFSSLQNSPVPNYYSPAQNSPSPLVVRKNKNYRPSSPEISKKDNFEVNPSNVSPTNLKPIEVNPPGNVQEPFKNMDRTNRPPRPDYKSMSLEEQENYKLEFFGKFRTLARSYPELDVTIPSSSYELDVLHTMYENYVHQMNVSKNGREYQTYITLLFFGIEMLFLKCGLYYAKGFAASQIKIMNKYDMLLIELGEFSLVGQMSDWPPLVKIILLCAFNAIVFILVNVCTQNLGISDSLKETIINGINGYFDGNSCLEKPKKDRFGIDPLPTDNDGIMGTISGFVNMFTGSSSSSENLNPVANLISTAGEFMSGNLMPKQEDPTQKNTAKPSKNAKKQVNKNPPGEEPIIF